MTGLNPDITIHQGSILECDVDAIVNPANSFLMNGAGLAGVIQRAAYGAGSPEARLAAGIERNEPALAEQARAQIQYGEEVHKAKLIPYGDARLTSAGALPFKGIIHAVGPIWGGGDLYESLLLSKAYHNALTLAENADFDSIAFPAISAGIFSVPIEIVAKEAVNMCKITGLRVVFALMDDAHVTAFRAALFDQGVWRR